MNISDKSATTIKPIKKTYKIGWKEFCFETWKIGLLAWGSVTMNDSFWNVVFTTAWFKTEWLNREASFFPLLVEFQEKFYATGKIWWNRFQRREGRPTDSAILTSRLIDRPIRPMFPKWIINDTQIIVSVLSSTGEKNLWSWWITTASIALLMTGSPFEWPVSWVNVILTNSGEFVFDPEIVEKENIKLSLTIAGSIDAITMVEAEWKEVSEEEMLKWLEYWHNIIKEICKSQIDFIKDYREQFWISKTEASFNSPDEELYEKVKEFLTIDKLESIYNKWKKEFQEILNNFDKEVKDFLISEKLLEEDSEANFVWALVYKRVQEAVRKNILEKDMRLDGRGLDEVREIVWETNFLPRTHWSALFQRGLTQALSITTLWWPNDEITIDDMMWEWSKRYMHHYNFPPYSVWEIRMIRWVWRREIWHWTLAEKALSPVLPCEEDFPYVIRVVSEITSCNGSSSMASVCWSTMSLMSAWVPIKRAVAWVAMGMIYDENSGKYKILSDIQAQEDFLWDMDFKLARTKNWITAMQLDVKIKWLKMDIFKETFIQWKKSTDYILDKMKWIIGEVSENLSPYAPLIMNIMVPEDKIREIIWRGWENIQRMEKEYQVKISIADDGNTTITAESQESGNMAIVDIKKILWVPFAWYKWKWKVVKIIDGIGAIVEFRWKSGMIHISKLSSSRVLKVEDVVKIWEEVEFTIIQVDTINWRIGLKKV
jgi:polyribonucleotide nucleotidyltransferase